ncbi:MAG: hypothetical protein H6Q89_5641 [Myxococcaceae bacterium]|nr:hypothetical protein [Myxococcaceae bacterium]
MPAITPEPEPKPDPEPDAAPPFLHRVEANGYLMLRGGFTRARVNGLIPTEDQPQFTGVAELNGQLKVSFLERSFAYADLSLIGQAAGNFRGYDLTNEVETIVPDHDVPANRSTISINELYALHEFLPELNLLLGKKRIVWGSGQAFNPTDLLNVRKDPTDPTNQRAGAWLARVEVPLETLVFSAIFAPLLLKQVNGMPQQFLIWPAWDQKDTDAHYLAAFRAYALVADADVNLMFMFSNLYGDSFTNKFRFGGSFSRYFFTDYELHTEFLIQSGTNRDYFVPECVASREVALACGTAGKPFLTKSRLDDSALYPKLLVGTRRQFGDESLLSIEYLYQADGYTRAQFQDLVNALDFSQQARALGVPANRLPNLNPTATADGNPQNFNFVPLVQHYLFVTYNKSRIFDDFTAQLVTIINLQDLSTVWTPSLSWSTTDWLTLSAVGLIPVRGLDSLAAKKIGTEQYITEYSNLPLQYRVLLEARVFY